MAHILATTIAAVCLAGAAYKQQDVRGMPGKKRCSQLDTVSCIPEPPEQAADSA